MRCNAELCVNWTGQGCICEVVGLDIDDAKKRPRETCDVCCVQVARWSVTNGGHRASVCSDDLLEGMVEVLGDGPRVVVSRLEDQR